MRDWIEQLDDISRDCVERYEYLLNRELKDKAEYIEINRQKKEYKIMKNTKAIEGIIRDIEGMIKEIADNKIYSRIIIESVNEFADRLISIISFSEVDMISVHTAISIIEDLRDSMVKKAVES